MLRQITEIAQSHISWRWPSQYLLKIFFTSDPIILSLHYVTHLSKRMMSAINLHQGWIEEIMKLMRFIFRSPIIFTYREHFTFICSLYPRILASCWSWLNRLSLQDYSCVFYFVPQNNFLLILPPLRLSRLNQSRE